jgi:hypothetical protein
MSFKKSQIPPLFPSPDSHAQTFPSFEETYQSSYSHGLETIYALETVDPKTIRRLNTYKVDVSTTESNSKFKSLQIHKPSNQHELDLGDNFRNWITPSILNEPIQVLELTRCIEKTLLDHHLKCICDILKLNFNQILKFRGLGQAHLQEIKEKIQNYLKGQELRKTKGINFGSLIRCVAADGNSKKVHLYLKKYHLDELITLIPSESLELRRLSSSAGQEWMKEAIQELQEQSKTVFVQQKIKEMANAFIKPWMRLRFGFATSQEILERVESICIDAIRMDYSLLFISDTFYSAKFPFSEDLVEVSSGIFSVDFWHDQIFKKVVIKAKTYFYKPSINYLLNELVLWLEREFAKSWVGFAEGMIEKILRLSHDFHLWKDDFNRIQIQLS